MDKFPLMVNAVSEDSNRGIDSLFATFGAVHLNVTSMERSVRFWTEIAGMKLRKTEGGFAELGSENKTLVVIHQSAKSKYQQGFSGLYHFAVHAPDKASFAKMLYRVFKHEYVCSPTDHTMSQSLYMQDPDGITIEFALETPQRFKRVVTGRGLQMEDVDGYFHPASAPLDVDEIMKSLDDTDLSKNISDDYKIGHIHFYANNVEKSNAFYRQLGFLQFNALPQFLYADVSAGGAYKHRIAMNSWHGQNRPLAPNENAGLQHYQIFFDTEERLQKAIENISYKKNDGNFWVTDPTGNLILLTHN